MKLFCFLLAHFNSFLIIICFSSSSTNVKRNSEVCPTFFTCVWFFLLETAQFDKSINMFCLVLLTLEFTFAIFFLQLTQYNRFPLFLYITQNFFFHYILLTHYLLKQILHAGIFSSTFLQPINDSKNPILNWVIMKLSLFMFFSFETTLKDFPFYSHILLTLCFRYLIFALDS